MSPVLRRYCAEFFGTFAIVFVPVGISAAGKLPGGDGSLMAAACVSGLVVAAFVYAFGPISAAHFNPAVTLAFTVAKRFSRRHVLPYLLAQALGSLVAAMLVNALFGGTFGALMPPTIKPDGVIRVLVMEIILAFLLMLVIMAVATDKRTASPVPALAIGLVIVSLVPIGGPVSGAAMNPARTLGPSLLAGGDFLNHYWLYAVGPILGAILAATVYENLIRSAPEFACSVPD